MGQPLLPGASVNHVLVTLPYPYGPMLEDVESPVGTNIRVLWLLPITAAEAGLNVVVSALTANDDARNYIKENVANLVLTYLKCPIDVCIERDSRGLYRKAREGKIDPKTLIGLDKPYAMPDDPEITIDTSKHNPEESILAMKKWLTEAGYNLF